ncbi:MAG: 2-hydroxy-6-oxohepta-2,4-dienoate hydrolase [Campylobacteraceae bacterium 4484_4]|nr:MAG: 2-hydroxy-6-oxohepta-2,4-dienoate hydrolase [Campylobacteraceae bacterium 4484_4]
MAQKEILYRNRPLSIAYEMVRPKASKTLLFLHGWGSNKEIMKQAFGNVFQNYRLLFVDMPGFGKSPNETEILTTEDYAKILKSLLEALSMTPVAIFGHSFGGKVATLMHPPLLVLLSSAGIVMPKPFSIRMKIALYKRLKSLGGERLRSLFASSDVNGMPQNMYETFKNVVDEDFSGVFGRYEGRALLFWGDSDSATPPEAGRKIASLIKKSSLFELEGDHYFFLHHTKEIENQTLKALIDGTS